MTCCRGGERGMGVQGNGRNHRRGSVEGHGAGDSALSRTGIFSSVTILTKSRRMHDTRHALSRDTSTPPAAGKEKRVVPAHCKGKTSACCIDREALVAPDQTTEHRQNAQNNSTQTHPRHTPQLPVVATAAHVEQHHRRSTRPARLGQLPPPPPPQAVPVLLGLLERTQAVQVALRLSRFSPTTVTATKRTEPNRGRAKRQRNHTSQATEGRGEEGWGGAFICFLPWRHLTNSRHISFETLLTEHRTAPARLWGGGGGGTRSSSSKLEKPESQEFSAHLNGRWYGNGCGGLFSTANNKKSKTPSKRKISKVSEEATDTIGPKTNPPSKLLDTTSSN